MFAKLFILFAVLVVALARPQQIYSGYGYNNYGYTYPGYVGYPGYSPLAYGSYGGYAASPYNLGYGYGY
ncbi:cuticle protein 6.4-like [Bombyx mandarina]|uniref:Cuticle protein 6.4-like n=2 Tax=Bombyx TaxID=7090 RepID=A0A6J2KBK4_BOMMA|nr:cuticle protein 6.4 [Bombyx mori]XP_028039038.1 cuticle protein 6.4-like [Bombyx mandarina]ACY06922.1 putative cuticle protein CPG43 [Bombyx mori]